MKRLSKILAWFYSNKKPEEDIEDIEDIEDQDEPTGEKKIGSLSYILDKDHMIWLSLDWPNGDSQIEDLADLLYSLHTGTLLQDSLNFIREHFTEAGQEEEYEQLLFMLGRKYFDSATTNQNPYSNESVNDNPVVKPTQVISKYGQMYQ